MSNRKGKRPNIKADSTSFPRKDNETEYGFVLKKLGGSNFLVRPHLQEKELIGHLSGKLRRGSNKKKSWVDVGSLVLLGLRNFEDKKVDILYTYAPDEIRRLKKDGEIVENVELAVSDSKQEELPEVEFAFEEI